ncbi:hypothetical protein BU17DRAFT_49813 [Hysterangium stoloniferum]|nr:hypothetical protein BU17DRAFT_49813 [Hysterangium stoloniferum]
MSIEDSQGINTKDTLVEATHDASRSEERDHYFPREPPHNGHTAPLHSIGVSSSVTVPVENHASAASYLQLFIAVLPPTLILKNTASTARDHLANERTWLAYMNTGLSFVGIGIALVQLLEITAFQSMVAQADMVNFSELGAAVKLTTRPLGVTIVFVGLVVPLLGLWRYFKIQQALVEGFFFPARLSAVVLTVVLTTFVVIIFGIFLKI